MADREQGKLSPARAHSVHTQKIGSARLIFPGTRHIVMYVILYCLMGEKKKFLTSLAFMRCDFVKIVI